MTDAVMKVYLLAKPEETRRSDDSSISLGSCVAGGFKDERCGFHCQPHLSSLRALKKAKKHH